jgi:pimeloyl-ACP methyl ester carboxylesterase
MSHESITFSSAGTRCDAWHFPAANDSLTTAAGRPIVVMAHGLGGTKDSGLESFAEGLTAAGVDVFAFDYRGFGASGGEPRQVVSLDGQLEDYRAAMSAAAAVPGVDPQRLVLWGVSLSGGTVLAAADGRADVAAVIALTPLVDGLAAAWHAMGAHPPAAMAKASARGLAGRVAAARGKAPVLMPLVGRPGTVAALSLDGLYEQYTAIAGPTWRNEIGATITLELGSHRPIKHAKNLTCPLLVQIADFDRSAPPQAAAKAAFKGRAEVHHYPCDHFDVHAGQEWHEAAIRHQVAFLRRKLGK